MPDDGDVEQGPGPLEDALHALLLRAFGRSPRGRELKIWLERIGGGMPAATFIRKLAASPGFTASAHVPVHSPPGHYFSPIVDPEQVRGYVERARDVDPSAIAGIEFDLPEMLAFWQANRDIIASTAFPPEPSETHRYHYRGGPYPIGDAITLRAQIHANRPRRIVEIGSGYSTACMVDAAEEAKLDQLAITCIEPYPDRLKSVLREHDWQRVTLREEIVQGVDLDLFRSLERNDILFIDSSHVLKTGSDVHYELFHILPLLKPGVLVHFHDVRYPFEYSDRQIFEKNYSWNEAYGVRALLMYSTRFKVAFYNSLFAREYDALALQTCPLFLLNPGSSIWLRVQDY